jgi:hypothetical protein
MTQNFVLFEVMQSSSDKSRTHHRASKRVTKKSFPIRATFRGAKPITGVEVGGATGTHRHLELPFGTNDDWERDNRDTVADSGGVLQPPQGIPEDIQATCRSALETKEENRQPMAVSR